MTGFQSKRMMSMDRHCDPITMEHIVTLRKALAEAERQRDNTLEVIMLMKVERERMNEVIRMLLDERAALIASMEYRKGLN